MGWQDRDYHQDEIEFRGSYGGRMTLPPIGATVLLGLHVVGFFLVLMMQFDVGRTAAAVFPLHGAESHPAAIFLHPIAIGPSRLSGLISLIFVSWVIWTLGGKIETRLGTGRLIGLYIAGNLAAGVTYYFFAQSAAHLARLGLAMPAGALAAWCFAAWRRFDDEIVPVLGRMMTVAKVAGLGAAIVIGIRILMYQSGATVWLTAVLAGAGTVVVSDWVASMAGGAREGARPRPAVRPARRAETEEPDIDDILAKISREGLDSLSDEERKRLDLARRSKLGKR